MLICFSATDALKGEGLQEGVDWLQGMMRVHMNELTEQFGSFCSLLSVEYINMKSPFTYILYGQLKSLYVFVCIGAEYQEQNT